jgi:hypothetical protein
MLQVVTHAFECGLVLSAIMCVLLLAVLRVNPEIMLNDYPPDIKARWGPMTDRTKRQRVPVTAVFLVVILAIVAWSLESRPRNASDDLTFAAAFTHFAVMFGTFNLVDWLVLDCGLVYFQPAFAVLPGTEGMAGYRSYWFHFRGFLIGVPLIAAASAVCAAVAATLL